MAQRWNTPDNPWRQVPFSVDRVPTILKVPAGSEDVVERVSHFAELWRLPRPAIPCINIPLRRSQAYSVYCFAGSQVKNAPKVVEAQILEGSVLKAFLAS